jgi:hypothetical protein
LSLQGVASPSLLNHGRVGLDLIEGHTSAPTKPRESRVYDDGEARGLLHDLGSYIPCLGGGYFRACVVFYEQGFGVLAYRFLYSLLQFYGLELHHLTPLRILDMVAFVTMCKAYMGIEPHFNLWNYFFHARLQQGSGMEVAALVSVDIFIRFGHRVDPYFHLSMPGLPYGW